MQADADIALSCRAWQYLQLGLFCLPLQVLRLVLLQGVLQLVLGLPAAGLCSLQLPQQLCAPATKESKTCIL